jgi:hypothetical protein
VRGGEIADLSYEKVLADNPQYRTTSNHDWMRYLNLLGFQVDQVDEDASPSGLPPLVVKSEGVEAAAGLHHFPY